MNSSSSRLLVFAVVYAIALTIWLQYVKPAEQPRVPPAQIVAQLRKEADQLLQEARTSEASLSRREREQKYRAAIQRLQQIARTVPNKDEAIDARFDEGAVYEEMFRMEGQSAGYLDQASGVYKALKKEYPRRAATISLNGPPQEVNVYDVANARLETVLKQRAEMNRSHVLYKLLDALVAMTGRIPDFSYWFALLLLTLIIKAVLYPFSKRQYKSMQDMQRVAPLIKEAQEKLKGRPAQEIQQRTMAIYKENNVNMAAGCLPALVQMAALFPLYYMILFYEYEFRKGTFLWIGSSLSREYPQYFATSLAAFDLPLFVAYLGSMLLTSLLTPPPADPVQARQQKMMMLMMPLMFGWMMYSAQWPAAFTFYWLILNLVSTAQQWYILKQHPPMSPAMQPSPSAAGIAGAEHSGQNGKAATAEPTAAGAPGRRSTARPNPAASRRPDAAARPRRKTRR